MALNFDRIADNCAEQNQYTAVYLARRFMHRILDYRAPPEIAEGETRCSRRVTKPCPFHHITGMTSKMRWQDKILDETRIGFVKEHGSKRKAGERKCPPPLSPVRPPPPLPPPRLQGQ